MQKAKPLAYSWMAAVAALVCALCIVVACSGCAGAPAQSSGGSSAKESESFSSEELSDIGETSSEAASTAKSASAAASKSAASSADLAWRDTDFRVDPNRTDWNFDGSDHKVVYLTIDDGPSQNTQAVLDILDQYGCKATFFVIGQDPASFPLIGEAYRRGHTIGLHSYTHDYATVYSSTGAFYDDLAAIGQVVADQIGYVPCFIRFPGGSSNGISADYCQGIMTELVGSVQANGYQYYDWNVSTGDGAEHTADEIVGYATAPNDYNTIVMLCHDSGSKQTTVEALPRIIEHYQALGYTFEALDRSSYVCHHGVNN